MLICAFLSNWESTLKKFISRVRPGVLLTRAKLFKPVMTFITLDLPALERPAIATSQPTSAGNCLGWAAPNMKEVQRKSICESDDDPSSVLLVVITQLFFTYTIDITRQGRLIFTHTAYQAIQTDDGMLQEIDGDKGMFNPKTIVHGAR